MKETKVAVVIQAPYPESQRIFPRRLRKWQNWYRMCVKAAWLARADNLEVVAFCAWDREVMVYRDTLLELGVRKVRVETGVWEAVTQVKNLREMAEKEDCDLVLVCDLFMRLRLSWLLHRRSTSVKYRIVTTMFALPNLQEMCTSTILIILFPIIDLLGYRDRYLKGLIRRRRDQGKL